MNRRDFMRGALVLTAFLASGKAVAEEKRSKKEKNLFRLTDRDNPSELEQKHVPAIIVSETVQADTWVDVKVSVGFMKEHPSTPDHWIREIALLAKGKKIARTQYKKGGVMPSGASFKIRLKDSTTLEAIEDCNLHGTWISDPVAVKVEV